jgi:hypothetical protein
MATTNGWSKRCVVLSVWLGISMATSAITGCDKLEGLTGKDKEAKTEKAAEESEPEEQPNEGLAQGIASASYTGTWKTPWGPVTMVQKGSTITGSYTGPFTGSLKGTVEGKVAEVTWRQTNGEHGKARFTISDDGDSFKGTWGSFSSATNGGPWNGTRQQ